MEVRAWLSMIFYRLSLLYTESNRKCKEKMNEIAYQNLVAGLIPCSPFYRLKKPSVIGLSAEARPESKNEYSNFS